MSILHRYMAKTVMAYIVLVLLVVVGLSFFINLLGEFGDIGLGNYGFKEALIHAVLRLPEVVYQFFPMVALLGVILGLGMLASHQELMVMRASGVSFKQIAQAVSTSVLLLVLIVTLLGEWIAPPANFLADQRKYSAKSGGQAVATAFGIWIHEKNDFFHIGRVTGQHHLEGVTRFQFDSAHQLLAAFYAESMDFDKHKWKVNHLVKTQFGKEKVVSTEEASDTWELTLSPNLLTVGMVAPDEMSLVSLYRYSRHLIKNGLQATEFQFSFWKRLFQPLATLMMVLLVVPFVLNTSRSVMIGRRIFLGVIVGFVFYILNSFLGQVSIVFQLWPWLAALLPVLLFLCLGALMVRRLR